MIQKYPGEKWTNGSLVSLENSDMGDHEKKEKIDMTESWNFSDRKTILFGRDF